MRWRLRVHLRPAARIPTREVRAARARGLRRALPEPAAIAARLSLRARVGRPWTRQLLARVAWALFRQAERRRRSSKSQLRRRSWGRVATKWQQISTIHPKPRTTMRRKFARAASAAVRSRAYCWRKRRLRRRWPGVAHRTCAGGARGYRGEPVIPLVR